MILLSNNYFMSCLLYVYHQIQKHISREGPGARYGGIGGGREERE